MAVDEDALVCDFAETYHIYDYRALPLKYAATLASGLGAESRIMKRISGENIDLRTALIAALVDNTNVLIWAKTKDAEKGRNYPTSILQKLTGIKNEPHGFASAEDFEAARRRILGEE